MVLYSLIIIVSSTLLVQSFHDSAQSRGVSRDILENPARIYRSNALPQSKDLKLKAEELSDASLQEIKKVVVRLLDRLGQTPDNRPSRNIHYVKSKLSGLSPHKKRKREKDKKCTDNKSAANGVSPKRIWDKWSEWSACSVTCGKGREIRWRNCQENCDGVETEMQEKSCQLPACGGKLFGLIKL